jgi:uncharacterized protein (TIGR02594 family)
VWLDEKHNEKGTWKAVTGNGDNSDPKKEDAPIPEGRWVVLQTKREVAEKDSWWENLVNRKGSDNSANERIGLIPFSTTDTHKRDEEFYIHGSKEDDTLPGVNLGEGIDDFVDFFVNSGKNLVLVVRYNEIAVDLKSNSDYHPPWVKFAEHEAKKWAGKNEEMISKHINYHQEVGINLPNMENTEHAWCASFVNYCLKKSGFSIFKPACRASAISTDPNFIKIEKPVFGSIALIGNYHVGFVYGIHETKNVSIILGGNQSDQINFQTFPGTITYFLPKEYKINENILSISYYTTNELNSKFGTIITNKRNTR